jgi:glycosyltransferase involved in cell wall biosynthesis
MIFSAEAVGRRMSFRELNTSLKIPVFNQRSKEIPYSVKKIKQALEPAVSNYELIVVNDGSMDNIMTIFERHSNDR